MSKERELLQRVLDGDADRHWTISSRLYKKIEEVLAQPEQGLREDLREDLQEDIREDIREGISLRDHFAGLAMQSLLTKASITVGSDSVAMAAYHVAHQMLKERSRGEKIDE